jgi:hypothetical protein
MPSISNKNKNEQSAKSLVTALFGCIKLSCTDIHTRASIMQRSQKRSYKFQTMPPSEAHKVKNQQFLFHEMGYLNQQKNHLHKVININIVQAM